MAVIEKKVSYILSIHDLLHLVKEASDKNNLPKVHILGILVSLDVDEHLASAVIDDGSGSILIRFFENNQFLLNAKIGDIVRILGYPRMLHNEIYFVPEIVKKLSNHKWIEHRILEIKILKPLYESTLSFGVDSTNEEEKQTPAIAEEEVIDEIHKDETKEIQEEAKDDEHKEEQHSKKTHESILDKVVKAIETLDSGKGAAIEEVMQQVQHDDCEKIIQKLIEQGEIFEVKPGRIKVL